MDVGRVIKGLQCCSHEEIGDCDNCPYNSSDKHYCDIEMMRDALELLKERERDEGWICEKRTSGIQPTDLLCACGNKVFFTTLLFKDNFTANELFCTNCGLTMRSPGNDKDGMWLKKNWKEVVLKEREPLEPVIIARQYECAECRYELRADADSYCPCCGRKVKWE